MKKVKKLVALLLVVATVISVMSMPAQAIEEQPMVRAAIATKGSEEVMPLAVIDRVYLTAAQCKILYDELGEYDSWPATIVEIIADSIDTGVGVATSLGAMFMQLNFNTTRNTLYRGYTSGKGCQMIIYDNAAPVFLVVN